jgi:hypothetical protein
MIPVILWLLLFPSPAGAQTSTTDCWKVGTTTRCETEQRVPHYFPGPGNQQPAPRVITDCWYVGTTLRCKSEPQR